MKKKKSNFKIIIVVILLIGLSAIVGEYVWQKNQATDYEKNILTQKTNNLSSSTTSSITDTTTQENGPLLYEINAKQVSATREIDGIFDYTAAELKSRADDCGTKYPEAYFENLVSQFSGAPKIYYIFSYEGSNPANSDGSVYSVTLLPNKAGYTSQDQFKKDFNLCSSGGVDNPLIMNNNWLLFVSSCGSGFNDGSGRINGCDEARKIIEPSLGLK
ncbi:MAG: hypothetical protein ACOYMB_01550 [Patescibacteria group bacterium]